MNVPMQSTFYTQQELADALNIEIGPLGATKAGGAMLLAHIDIETDSGRALWNNNVGNITSNGSGNWWQPTKGAAAALKFKAYPTLLEGVADYVSWIHKRPAFWAAAMAGDATEFARQIDKTGYTPGAPLDSTSTALSKLAAGKEELFPELGPSGPFSPVPRVPVSTVAPVVGTLALVVGVGLFAWIAWGPKGSYAT